MMASMFLVLVLVLVFLVLVLVFLVLVFFGVLGVGVVPAGVLAGALGGGGMATRIRDAFDSQLPVGSTTTEAAHPTRAPGRDLAVGEAVILLHHPLPLVGVSIGMERGESAK